MAKIERSEIINEVVQGLRLDVGREKIPNQTGDIIQPVYIAGSPPALVKTFTDAVVNDSDKTFTVPTNKQWKLLGIKVALTTTATAGNRRIQIQLSDENNNLLFRTGALNVQVASTGETYIFSPAFTSAREDISTIHNIPLIDALLLPGSTINLFDSGAVAPAADDMTVSIWYEERDVSQQQQ